MVGRQQFGDRAHRDHLFVRNHRHPIADFIQRIQIVGDQEYREIERLLQFGNQRIERRGADRVEASSGLIEEQHFGIERQRARQSGTLAHPARQLRRIAAGGVGWQARQQHFVARDLVPQFVVDFRVEFLERHFDVFAHGQRREQRSALEQHTPARTDVDIVVIARIGDRAAEHFDRAFLGDLQPDDRAHQHRLARARTADHADDLAAPHIEI